MVKKILYSGLIVFFMASVMFAIHLFYQPQPAPLVLLDYGRTISFDYEDIDGYVKNRDGKHYLFFCDSSIDCQFVNDNYLKPLTNEVKESDFVDLIFVDMSHVREDISPTRFLNDWGFSTYPAFVAISVEEQQKTIDNVLQWELSNPFSKADIKQWMIDNEIWKGPIDQPTDESSN